MHKCSVVFALGLIVTVGTVCPKARADTLSEDMTTADRAFRTAAYDQAASAYSRGLDELAAQQRFQDLKFLTRDLSDLFFEENTRYQPKANAITAHGYYVKLCTHSQLFFERYCELVVRLDPNPDEKLTRLADKLLPKLDFRGALALAAIAKHVPQSPLAARALVRAGSTWRTWAGIQKSGESGWLTPDHI